MYCVECGSRLQEGSNFCSECGTRVAGQQAPTASVIATSREIPPTSRVCEWCSEAIPQSALRCPRCQKWRKDIDKERILAYVWGGAAILPLLLFIAGLRGGWWHQTVEDSNPYDFYVPLASEFSIEAFLSSGSGIAVLIGFLVTGLASLYYYAKVSSKIGSWWWF